MQQGIIVTGFSPVLGPRQRRRSPWDRDTGSERTAMAVIVVSRPAR
jgi:hypothetical protein